MEIPPGEHLLTLQYRNPLIPAGGLLSLLAVAGVAGLTLFDNYRSQEYRAKTKASQ